jgi:hypothetical protein
MKNIMEEKDLIKYIGKEIVNTNFLYKGIISGIGNHKETGVLYVVINYMLSNPSTDQKLKTSTNLLKLKLDTDLVYRYYIENDTRLSLICITLKEFEEQWKFISSLVDMKESSISLTLQEARELFGSSISWGVKEKLLKNYSKRELKGLPQKIELYDIKVPHEVYKILDNKPSKVLFDNCPNLGTCADGIYLSEKECLSAIAFWKLLWLVREYTIVSGISKPDWSDIVQDKYCIIRRRHDTVGISKENSSFYPLAFTSKEIAEIFFEDYEELIKQYYML